MMHDKKVQHGRLRFVLPTRLGHVELVAGVKSEDVRARVKLACIIPGERGPAEP